MSSKSHNYRANHRAHVNSITEVAPAHYQIQLEVPALAQAAQPGQFVHILTVPNSHGLTLDPLLRRAFSIMSVNAPERTAINVLFRVEGRGTQTLAKARKGDEIDLIGPLGRPFDVSPFDLSPVDSLLNSTLKDDGKGDLFHVKQPTPAAIVVGGGVGVPPLVYLSQMLESEGVDVHAIVGARSSGEIIGWHELSAVCQKVGVTTDDGSRGHHGRVTDLLAPSLENAVEKGLTGKPVVYSCGPFPMLRAVAQLCANHQVRCQVSLEENMPCGIGVCNGCVVRTRQPFANDNNCQGASEHDVNRDLGSEWSPYRAYRRVCVEGPACWADEIDWEHQG